MADIGAQGSTWTERLTIIKPDDTFATNALSAGHLTVHAFRDAAGTDVKASAVLTAVSTAEGAFQVAMPLASNAPVGTWSGLLKWNDTVNPIEWYDLSFLVMTAAQFDPASVIALQIGTLSVAQLPLATGTGGGAIWLRENP